MYLQELCTQICTKCDVRLQMIERYAITTTSLRWDIYDLTLTLMKGQG